MGLFNFSRKKKDLPQKPGFIERRMLPRWKIVSSAKVKLQNSEDYIACEVRDLNLRGFCLGVAEEISGNEVRMELYFNEKYFFDIEASVTWHKEADGKHIYGLKFLRVRDSDREKIYQMMKDIFSDYLGKL
ncbi:MAG: PilZ domain-containing protein [Candidatus Omnitrophica bacterium]|nr:PilZ domain-containing protein [Candidatus Omnitrophota bacterium]